MLTAALHPALWKSGKVIEVEDSRHLHISKYTGSQKQTTVCQLSENNQFFIATPDSRRRTGIHGV